MIFEAVAFGLLLPLLAAGVVLVAVARLGKGGRAVAATVALVAGFAVGNHFRPAAEYRIDADRPLALGDFTSEILHAVSGVPDEKPHPPARYWLPWAALFAGAIGLIARVPKLPSVVGHLLRALTAVLVARLLVGPGLRAEVPWLWATFAAVVLAEWELLDALGKDGWLPWGLGLVFLSAGAVLLHAHTARMTDLATFVAGGCLGVAFVARWAGADLRGIAPVAAVALPGLLLDGQQSTYSEVPWYSFALVALAPLALAPLVLVPERYRRWQAFAGLGLLLAAAGVAVLLAWWAEPLSFD